MIMHIFMLYLFNIPKNLKMYKKTIFLILLCLNLVGHAKAQRFADMRHYLSINSVYYQDFYNKEKDVVSIRFPYLYFNKYYFPCFSYKMEYDRLGAEFFASCMGLSYYRLDTYTPEYMPKGGIQQILSYTLGITVQYSVLSKKYLKINPMLGFSFCEYNPTVLAGWRRTAQYGGWNEPYEIDQYERRHGLLTGLNINIPIWRGIYANTNARYLYYPSAQYNKQNLILDFGLGYSFQIKKH